MEIFERFGYMRSIFKCELSCGLELKGDYSLLTDDNQACIVFLPTCLSEYGGGGVPPYHGGGGGGGESGPLYGARSSNFSLFICGSQHMYVPRTQSRTKVISQRSTCKFSTKNTAMALSLIFLRRLCLGSGATL